MRLDFDERQQKMNFSPEEELLWIMDNAGFVSASDVK